MTAPSDKAITPVLESSAVTVMQRPCDQPEIALPIVLCHRYQCLAKLGGGGMAQVFQAYDPHLDRPVAVKLINPKLRADQEFDARFRREAQIVSKLNDPHVVVAHDFGLDPEYGPFLVMELLHGETLRERLNAKGPLPVPAALQLGEQIMLALAHAHEHGVIHRDLKPDNVFLVAQSGMKLHVRVLDFGISQILQPDRPGASITEPGAIVGTPRYMAPEQTSGRPATERSDLYSAALVCYEALTGQLPNLFGAGLRDKCENAPADLERLIEQCLRSDPDERPVSATEAYLHLHELARTMTGELLVSASAVNQLTARFREPAPSKRPPRMTRRMWIASIIGGAMCALSLVWVFWPPEVPHPLHESMMDLTVGDHRDDMVAKLGKPAESHEFEALSKHWSYAPLVTLDDLAMDQAERKNARLDVYSNVAVVCLGTEVRSVMAKQHATTGRNLKFGDKEETLRQIYPEKPVIVVAGGSPWSLVYRYPELGLAIEVRGGRVIAAAVFPRQQIAPGH